MDTLGWWPVVLCFEVEQCFDLVSVCCLCMILDIFQVGTQYIEVNEMDLGYLCPTGIAIAQALTCNI